MHYMYMAANELLSHLYHTPFLYFVFTLLYANLDLFPVSAVMYYYHTIINICDKISLIYTQAYLHMDINTAF